MFPLREGGKKTEKESKATVSLISWLPSGLRYYVDSLSPCLRDSAERSERHTASLSAVQLKLAVLSFCPLPADHMLCAIPSHIFCMLF